jgi:hypothetical protein
MAEKKIVHEYTLSKEEFSDLSSFLVRRTPFVVVDKYVGRLGGTINHYPHSKSYEKNSEISTFTSEHLIRHNETGRILKVYNSGLAGVVDSYFGGLKPKE